MLAVRAMSVEHHRHVFEIPEWPDGEVGAWWVSYTDGESHFVGVVILTGFEDRDFIEVATEVNRLVPGDAGQAVCIRYSKDELEWTVEEDHNRLLSKADLDRIGENSRSVGEMFGGWPR